MAAGTKPGFRNWVSKIGKCKTFGHQTVQGRQQYTQITTKNMYLLNEIKHTSCPYTMPWELY